jgi:SAM-dependent methyltransferase
MSAARRAMEGPIGCTACSSRAFPKWLGSISTKKRSSPLQAKGLDVRLADAQDFDLDRKFDTVFAGEIIEHLDDFHGFLTSVRRHLTPGGQLVLTTPNVFYIGGFVYRWGGHGQVHPEHTCWFCEDTLRRVLAINGYSHFEIAFSGHRSPTPLRRAATLAARHVLPPRLALDTLIAVATAD